jgi:hypothetical protein
LKSSSFSISSDVYHANMEYLFKPSLSGHELLTAR